VTVVGSLLDGYFSVSAATDTSDAGVELRLEGGIAGSEPSADGVVPTEPICRPLVETD
jgi:hypothetical protein